MFVIVPIRDFQASTIQCTYSDQIPNNGHKIMPALCSKYIA